MTTPNYIWPAPDGNGWIDAWNGWYETEAQAIEEAQPAVIALRPWVLEYGDGLIDQDELDARTS